MEDEQVNEVQNYDALVVWSETKTTERVLNAGAAKLKAIGRAGAGADNINPEKATTNNVNGCNSVSAWELTCILIGALAVPVCPAAESKKQVAWSRKRYGGT